MRRRARRALSGGPAQGRAETLGGQRGLRHPAGHHLSRGNRHDSPLLAPTLQAASRQLDHLLPADRTCHLDRGYDSQPTRQLLDQLGFNGEIARKGVPAPIQAGARWVVERTHSWMNGYGKLRRCTEAQRQDRGLLPLPRRRARHDPPADPASPRALPLGHPPDHQAAQVTPIARHSKPGMPSSRVAGQRRRSDGPAAGPAQRRSRARQRLGIDRRGRRQRGTFGSGGCPKTNHPGTWIRSGQG